MTKPRAESIAKWLPTVSVLIAALVFAASLLGNPSCGDLQTKAEAKAAHTKLAADTAAVRAEVSKNHDRVMDRLEALRLEVKADMQQVLGK